ncbi:MAG: hypothetical protein GXO48_04375 [Chlorobi bacterium]|nr:hypothetical protein [Chlorobiota bacterium]
MPRIPTQISSVRKVFLDFKKQLENPKNSKAVEEFENALFKLITDYNTTIYANRFIVGDVVEILLCALIKAVGLKCEISNQERTDLYIQIPNGPGGMFSIKSNFTGSGTIRLINVMGSSEGTTWSEPTIFLIAGKGIYYADPYMNIPVKRTGDAITVNIKDLENVKDELKLTGIRIPQKPDNPQSAISPAYDVVKSILETIKSKKLIKHV